MKFNYKNLLRTLWVFLISLCLSNAIYASVKNGIILNDVSQLNPTPVSEVINVKSTEDILNALEQARKNHWTISISGKSHSQGGQTLYPNSLHLNMLGYNKILALNKNKKTITVQSGATWADIQKYINPYNLSIKTMQSSNIFTVGGSLSVNAHGLDPNAGPIIATAQSFHLLQSDGKIIRVSRSENPQLFRLVIGGYGLFGVILDATLELTDNNILKQTVKLMNYRAFPMHLKNNIENNHNVSLFFARMSITPGRNFLRQIYVVSFIDTKYIPKISPKLIDYEKNDYLIKSLFNLSRKSTLGKDIRWNLERDIYEHSLSGKLISRNNAMRPPIQFLLDYHSQKNADILQEYFIPINNFNNFIDGFRKIAVENKINLLNVTIRYVPKNLEAYLSYANQNCFSIVIYINQSLSMKNVLKMQNWTRQLVDLSIKNAGTYYLPYQLYPTKKQLRQVYPKIDTFFALKRHYDSQRIFLNNFYEYYK